MKTTILALLAGVTAVGCAQITEPLAPERVILEIERMNFAWAPTYAGYIVDGAGRVFEYDRKGTPWAKQDAESWTAAELAEKFRPHLELVGTRPAGEVADIAAKIEAAAAGPLSQLKGQCADAGTLTYRAYRYDAETGRYRPVLLRVQGDIAQQNLSEAGQELIAYIRSLHLVQEYSGCEP